MAKQIIEWKETDGRLHLNRKNALPAETLAIFDIRKVFPQFPYMTDVQKHLTVYGIKQTLADAGSAEKDAKGKADKAREKWNLYLSGKIRAKKAGAVSKAKQLDALLNMSPEDQLKELARMRANA